MKSDFPAQWAESPASLRREPTPAEMAGGFPCGDLDLQLFNGLFFRLAQSYRELSYVITASGQTPNQNDTTQVWQAILAAVSSGTLPLYYGLASGTPSAITVATTSPTPRGPVSRGSIVLVEMPANLSAGAGATFALGSQTASPWLRNDGSPVQVGDAPPGSLQFLAKVDAGWKLLAPGRAESPRTLGTSTIYFGTDGSDTGDGRSTASPLRTLGAALDLARSYYLLGRPLTIQITQPGTYDIPTAIPDIVGSVVIRGNPSAQGSYILQGAGPSGSTGRGVLAVDGWSLSLVGLTVRNTGTSHHTLAASGSGALTLTNVTLTSNSTLPFSHCFVSSSSANAVINSGCIWASSAINMIEAKGEITIASNAALSVQNNPAFSVAAAVCSDCGRINSRSGVVISGAATGSRYLVTSNAVIRASGGGQNLFPGNQLGDSNTGGIYLP